MQRDSILVNKKETWFPQALSSVGVLYKPYHARINKITVYSKIAIG